MLRQALRAARGRRAAEETLEAIAGRARPLNDGLTTLLDPAQGCARKQTD